MSREKLVEMAKVSIRHNVDGTTPLTDSITSLPATNYYDPDRFADEVAKVFRRLPLALGLSCEIPQPGDFKSMDVAGMPVLMVRNPAGEVRAFVNMCSHRGAMLVQETHGSARRFTCPYHAWSYNTDGELVGVFRGQDFGEIDASCMGLTPLPSAERAGLIWVVLAPQSTLDIDTFLSGFDVLAAHLRLAEMHHYGTRILVGPNWKVAFDGYVDFYHLPILHKNTFGPDMSPDAIFHKIGPHQRVTGPRQKWAKLADIPEDEWDMRALTGGVWSIFPHGSIAGFEVDGQMIYQVARLFPGATVGESVTHLDFVSLAEPTDDFIALAEKQIAFLVDVVEGEDYATGLRLQRTLQSGAKPLLYFGRNEGGAQHVHGWLDKVLATADDDLTALFASAT